MSEDAPIYGTGCHYCDEQEANCGMHGVSPWIPADKELPGNMRCVLATDMECHFIAIYESDNWICATTSDEIDSHVTHWMELPEVPIE
jgi:hypothetical protein